MRPRRDAPLGQPGWRLRSPSHRRRRVPVPRHRRPPDPRPPSVRGGSCSRRSPASTSAARTRSSMPPSPASGSPTCSPTCSCRCWSTSATSGRRSASASARSTSAPSCCAAGCWRSRAAGAPATARWRCSPAPRASTTTSAWSPSGSCFTSGAGGSPSSVPTPRWTRSTAPPTCCGPRRSSSRPSTASGSGSRRAALRGLAGRHRLLVGGSGADEASARSLGARLLDQDPVAAADLLAASAAPG